MTQGLTPQGEDDHLPVTLHISLPGIRFLSPHYIADFFTHATFIGGGKLQAPLAWHLLDVSQKSALGRDK